MEKTIGITTSAQSFSDNYGAVLQAYALCRKLSELGCTPLIVKYRVDGEYARGAAPVSKRLKATLLNRNMSFHAKKNLLLNRLLGRSTASVFKVFVDKHLRFYNDRFTGFEQLRQCPPDCDAFITGSDQVWNPVIHGNKNDPGYFLDFVPEEKRRIAYAPSMGVDCIPDSCKEDLKDYLDKFYALSVREQSGADIIRQVCGIDVEVVLDPTLLLTADEWDKAAEPAPFLPSEYILVYKFGKSKVMDAVIKNLSAKYRLPVVCVPASPETRFKMDYRIGPGEFISAIKNATIVCTDSFHASVFSILYNKPFLTFPRHEQSSKVSMNSRMTGLLDMLGLDRYITDFSQWNPDTVFSPDFTHANTVLAHKRDRSIEYLKNSVKGI